MPWNLEPTIEMILRYGSEMLGFYTFSAAFEVFDDEPIMKTFLGSEKFQKNFSHENLQIFFSFSKVNRPFSCNAFKFILTSFLENICKLNWDCKGYQRVNVV